MSRPIPDQALRKQALSIDQSFIVQAPAGSGKTTLLIQRILMLLQTAQSPEDILAITFTNKAANEMRCRILNALQQATDPAAQKVLERDKQLGWYLLENPNQLRIQTIDAFCASLVKQFPLQTKIGPKTEITDMPLALYEEAVQEVLDDLEKDTAWSADIEQLLLHLDNDINKLKLLMVKLLEKRDQWLPYLYFETTESAIKEKLEQYLSHLVNDHLQALNALITLQEKTAICEALSLSHPATLAEWRIFAEGLLTKAGQWRKKAPLYEALSDKDQLRAALFELFILPDEQYDPQQWHILKALFSILKITLAQLKLTFQKHRQIDFIENANAALHLLTEDNQPTETALWIDQQIKHILVDEFQDISYAQFKLIEKLTAGWVMHDGRTLFLVGDPMQSIYRFRNAEVSLFIQAQEKGISNISLTPLVLTTNFRSTPTIINWYNQYFKQLFPAKSAAKTGAVHYTLAHAAMEAEGPSPVFCEFEEEMGEQQSSKIVEMIMTHQTSHPEQTIAILVRARQHLANIIPALKKANIAYEAIDIDPLLDKQSIIDVLTLTSALLHPENRIAWLALLRAPWCGLSLADLWIIANSHTKQTILEQLQKCEVLSQLSPEGQQRVKRILPILQNAIDNRERKDFRAFVEKTWIFLGGPACLQQASDLKDVQAYFELIAKLAAQQTTITIEKIKRQAEKLFAKATIEKSNVKLMTIHSAKGLEFDTVIIPHLEKKGAHDTHPLLLWMEQPLENESRALLLAPMHAAGNDKDAIYNYILHQQKIKFAHEMDRLFYVAATRAKNHLYFLFNKASQPGSFLKRLEQVSLMSSSQRKLGSSADIKVVDPSFHWDDSRDDSRDDDDKPRSIARLTAAWQMPLPYPAETNTATHQTISGFQWQDNSQQLLGTLIHQIFQQFSERGLNWWQEKNNAEKNSFLKQHLLRLGLAVNKLESMREQAREMLENVLKDSRAQWIFHPHPEAQSELAISVLLDNQLCNVVIDRTFVENGIRWIIDYKTTMLEHHVEEKIAQYAVQLHQYQRAMTLFDARPIKLGLYFSSITKFIEISSSDIPDVQNVLD